MKKVLLLIVVAAALGTGVFLFIAKHFKQQQIESRVNELGALIRTCSGATRVPLERNWWAGSMAPAEVDIPQADYKPGVSFGRQEWFGMWQELASEAGSNMVRKIEDLQVGAVLPDLRAAGVDPTPVTWTWHQGVPGEWGERINMGSLWVYEHADWKISRLELLSRTENVEPPVADPK